MYHRILCNDLFISDESHGMSSSANAPTSPVAENAENIPRVNPMSWILYAFLFVVRIWPASQFHTLAGLIRLILRPIMGKELQKMRRNLHIVWGLPPKSHFSEMFVRQVVRHQIICTLESLRASFDPRIVQVAGMETLQLRMKELSATNKGVIVITGHMGSWELVGHYCAVACGQRFHALAKPSSVPGVSAVLERMRGRMNIDVLWTNRKSLLRQMISVLRSGKSLGFVMDQKPEGRRGPVVNFFGWPTEFVTGPAAMARSTGAAVIGIFCMREGPWRYRILSNVLYPPDQGNQDEQSMVQVMAQEIERVIRLYPEQWTWNYRRWRFDPRENG